MTLQLEQGASWSPRVKAADGRAVWDWEGETGPEATARTLIPTAGPAAQQRGGAEARRAHRVCRGRDVHTDLLALLGLLHW